MSEYVYTTEGAFGLRECTGEEIVRCKDCVWANPDQSDHEFREIRCNMWIADVSADGFCSRGKRKP